jgi:hypothetical protein
MTTFKQFIEIQKTTDEQNKDVPAFLRKQAGPTTTTLDRLKNKMKIKMGHKPIFLKKQAESAS